MKFQFDITNPQQQFIHITAEFTVLHSETIIYLPVWRPGRYERGNFAKNVRNFKVFTSDKQPLSFEKIGLSQWKVNTANCDKIFVNYDYYSNELNAGSTYLDESQLYVNPVNCCVFTDESYSEEISLDLKIPEAWKIAGSLRQENSTLFAENFDELADSPFICSAHLQHKTYELRGTTFHVWFNGIVHPDWDRLIPDFEKFSLTQIKYFSNIPTEEYHFLFHILPIKAYHGVEHSKSTVICLGPSFAVFEELYKELLGVSSHELYHTWNIKSIRPKGWMPYNFKEECPSRLGYVAEGVTTYMGDLILLKSGVFSLEQYFVEMNANLQKHYDNFGRLNYSVADSSFDTWLDGYIPGAPGRKVSIYTEGALLAFVADVFILKQTNNKEGLVEVMRKMYLDFGEKGIGYTAKDYQDALEAIAGTSMQWLFDEYINNTTDYTSILKESFAYLGLEMVVQPSPIELEAYLGIKIDENNQILAVYPNCPLDNAGVIVGDILLSINNMTVEKEANRWAKYYRGKDKNIIVSRKGYQMQLHVPFTKETFYQQYSLKVMENISEEQKEALRIWS